MGALSLGYLGILVSSLNLTRSHGDETRLISSVPLAEIFQLEGLIPHSQRAQR